jgi:hypothetical protein
LAIARLRCDSPYHDAWLAATNVTGISTTITDSNAFLNFMIHSPFRQQQPDNTNILQGWLFTMRELLPWILNGYGGEQCPSGIQLSSVLQRSSNPSLRIPAAIVVGQTPHSLCEAHQLTVANREF